MSTSRDIDLGEFNVANVDRYLPTILKDGVAWSGIDSVSIIFEKPDRSTQLTRSMTVFNDSAGQWYYDSVVTDFPNESASLGDWTVTLEITDGTIVKRYPYEIHMHMNSQP